MDNFWQTVFASTPNTNTIVSHPSLSTGLQRYWDFDASGSFVDKIGSVSGVINGATYTASGKIGGAYKGNGSSQWIDSGAKIPSRTAGTFNIWVKDTRTTDTADTAIVADSGGGYFILRSSKSTDGKFTINFFSSGDKQIQETTAHSKNTWHMLTVTWNSATLEFFVNNSSQGTLSAGALGNNSNNLDFFTNSSVAWFEGESDECGIWNKVLSASEITDLYNGGNGIPYD